MANEILILEHTALDTYKYSEALNCIFERRLSNQIKQRVE
jgi:hypothetical protein